MTRKVFAMSFFPKTIVIIPAYNEEKSIGIVVKKILKIYPEFTILVIDDGSNDNTADIAFQAGAKVIRLPQNLGIGGAVQTGYLYALYNKYEIAIQIDADGQHKPEELHKILKPIVEKEADLVIGSRYVKKTQYKSTFSRRVGMIILSALVSLITKQVFKDTTSGFRAANRKVIKLFAKEYSTDYPEVDSLVVAKMYGLNIKEVSVEMEQRIAGSSSITPLRSVYYMIKVSLSLLVRAIRYERMTL
ncbi:glycosyltransferase family 2 protein [Carboxydocella sp. ULO1]|uniref:glycosyltransferase family 2 protein n=1 Tax=Carboxydocella sp. ULO1 TaxID=1926599 RepID=UPI0027D8B5EE|nr:glycosyltransferase family 2 protein [Carboxydocella sp. ULO1]